VIVLCAIILALVVGSLVWSHLRKKGDGQEILPAVQALNEEAIAAKKETANVVRMVLDNVDLTSAEGDLISRYWNALNRELLEVGIQVPSISKLSETAKTDLPELLSGLKTVVLDGANEYAEATEK